MKNMKFFILCIGLLGLVLSGCGSSPHERTFPSLPMDRTPRINESELIIQHLSSFLIIADGVMNVFVDGELRAQVLPDSSERIIVPNGSYRLQVRRAGSRRISFDRTINVESQRLIFSVTQVMGTVSLSLKDEIDLAGRNPGITRAASTVGNNKIDRLPSGSSVAVLSVASDNPQDAIFVVSELEHILVNSGQFQIVDRNLESVRLEQRFQLSGDVSDETAVEIGNMIGANIVLTGRITMASDSSSLTVRAIDVRTGQIISLEREFF